VSAPVGVSGFRENIVMIRLQRLRQSIRIGSLPGNGRLATIAAAWALSLVLGTPLAAQSHPFGSRPMAYAAGAILPNHRSQAVLDQAVRDFYDAWKSEYLAQDCGPGRYLVLTSVRGGNLTVSEGHGYGMILAALMAGHDPQARAIFDGMYAYFREHPTAGYDRLMAWNQTRSCENSTDGDSSATDGDLDIAWALLLADRQWGSCGAIDYRAEALAVLDDILAGDVDPAASYTLLGDWTDPNEPGYWQATRSSDFMPAHYRSFLDASGDGRWTNLRDSQYDIVAAVQANHSPLTGLLPDFIVGVPATPAPAPPFFIEADSDGDFSYNACRDPWRVATDFLVSGDARARATLQPVNAWIRTATGNDPALIGAGYALDGTPLPDTDYRSMAFVAPLGVGAMVDAANQSWLNATWDLVVATPLADEAYYENTLKLLGMIAMSGNWWAPEEVAGGCVAAGTPACVDGGYVVNTRVQVAGIGRGPGRQSLKITGALFFPEGMPVPALDGGAQILIEDLGAGAARIFDLTAATAPVPGTGAPACSDDGWKVAPRSTTYFNRSGALGAPVCSAGSANGLRQIRYKRPTSRDVTFQIRSRNSTIPAVVGPLRVTLVLGDEAASSAGGECGLSRELTCTGSASGFRCS
jgi:endo-1,4-beta-D-glucanase Y